MSIFFLLQLAFNIVVLLGVWVLWTKFRKPAKDDPRLSRGLQLLQSKIAVLEDLSDKTDHQVNQIVAVLEKKCKELQGKVQEASNEVNRVECSIQKSLEVSEIFEDRIPHQAIIERQKTKSYVQAAQLAHQGVPIDQISKQVDLPIGEIELIAKVNRDRLMFSQEHLPAWASGSDAKSESIEEPAAVTDRVDFQMENMQIEDSSVVFKPLVERPKSLEKIGEEFRKACQEVETEQAELDIESKAEQVIQQISSSAVNKIRSFSEGTKKKVQEMTDDFARMDVTDEIYDSPAGAGATQETPQEMSQEARRDVVSQASQSTSVEVMGSQPGLDSRKQVGERKQVSSEQIKRVEFPRIGLTTEIR